MFVSILNYIKPFDEVMVYRDSHVEFLKLNYQKGNFVVSGRRTPSYGGLIVAKDCDREEMHKILQEDPFIIHKVAEYTLYEFDPLWCADGLEKYAPNATLVKKSPN